MTTIDSTMSTAVATKVEEIRSDISEADLESMTRDIDLADVILMGSQYSKQEYGWASEDCGNMCALSAATAASKALGLI